MDRAHSATKRFLSRLGSAMAWRGQLGASMRELPKAVQATAAGKTQRQGHLEQSSWLAVGQGPQQASA